MQEKTNKQTIQSNCYADRNTTVTPTVTNCYADRNASPAHTKVITFLELKQLVLAIKPPKQVVLNKSGYPVNAIHRQLPLFYRFAGKVLVDAETNCWNWVGALTSDGYPLFVADKFRSAHRFIYEVFNDPIPNGLEVDHLCRRRYCVNPSHLEAVSHRENMRRCSKPALEEWRRAQASPEMALRTSESPNAPEPRPRTAEPTENNTRRLTPCELN